MDLDTWGIVSIALASGVAVVVTAMTTGLKDVIIAWARRLITSIHRKTYLGHIRKMAKFLDYFESLREIKEVQRCVMFTGHNCGGMPLPGKTYTVQSLDGWSTYPEKINPSEAYNFSMRVDAHYTKLLQEMIERGRTTQLIGDMPQDALLRAYYESEGVHFTSIYFLGLYGDELIYLSVGSYDKDSFSRHTEIELQLAVDRMRALISGIE